MRRTGQWDSRRRRRHRHLRRMAMGNMLGLAPLMMMVLLGLWWDTHCTAHFQSEEYGEASFRETCDRVVSWIDDYRNEHGHLPDSLMAEGLVLYWADNCYVDTTKWDQMEFKYYHEGDSAYSLVDICPRMRCLSTPKFEGYLFHHWDEGTGQMRVDTVFRHSAEARK